jgi:hypothetical protein
VVEIFDSEGDNINSIDYSSLLDAPIKGLHLIANKSSDVEVKSKSNAAIKAFMISQDGKAYL